MTRTSIKPVMMGEFQVQILRSIFPHADLPVTRGGPAVSNLVLERLKRGLPTDIITLDQNASSPIQYFESDLVNLWVVKRRPNKCIRDGYLQERKLILEALKQSDADICHAHWTYEYGLSAVTQGIKPYVLTVRDHSRNILRWIGKPYLGQYLITQYVLRRASGQLTAVSPYISKYVSRISKGDVPVVPNLMPDLSRMSALSQKFVGEKEACHTIITAADAGKHKNVKRAIRAFQLFRGDRDDVRYLLMGAGLGSEEAIAKWAYSKGLADHVIFLGWKPHGEVLKKMRHASVVLHPSLEESFGNPVAEAMAMGVPVIGASEAGGVRWLLDENVGWLVSGRSVENLADTLSKVLGNPQMNKEKCLRAADRIHQICNPDKILRDYEIAYGAAMDRWNSAKTKNG